MQRPGIGMPMPKPYNFLSETQVICIRINQEGFGTPTPYTWTVHFLNHATNPPRAESLRWRVSDAETSPS